MGADYTAELSPHASDASTTNTEPARKRLSDRPHYTHQCTGNHFRSTLQTLQLFNIVLKKLQKSTITLYVDDYKDHDAG